MAFQPTPIQMQLDITGRDLPTLLALYNQEMDNLREKLLDGESWDNLKANRRNITELAIAINKCHSQITSDRATNGNPAEFPQIDEVSQQPIE